MSILRLRWLYLVLPLFALFSALHIACTGGNGSSVDGDYDGSSSGSSGGAYP